MSIPLYTQISNTYFKILTRQAETLRPEWKFGKLSNHACLTLYSLKTPINYQAFFNPLKHDIRVNHSQYLGFYPAEEAVSSQSTETNRLKLSEKITI
jgi:hypothetical protein